MNDDIEDLKASLVLDFCIREIEPTKPGERLRGPQISWYVGPRTA